MKELSLEQMENIQGGKISASCAVGIAASFAGTLALGLATGGLAIFLVAYGVSMASWTATAIGCAGY